MGHGHKFDISKLDKLKDPERLKAQNPDKIWEAIGGSGAETLVEIGAGIGFFAIPFARKIPQGRVYACDISGEMLEHLAGEIEKAGIENIVEVKTGEVDVPLDDGMADIVTMFNLHHELDHPNDSLTECSRLLKPGGGLAIIDWKAEETPKGPPVNIRIPEEKVTEQLKTANFEQIRSHPILPDHYLITALKPVE